MRYLFLFPCAALALAAAASAQAPKTQGFDDFKLIKTRNVFDPNRRATRTETSREREPRSERPQIARSNTLTLTGTMVSDDRTIAFFGGSRSEYSKVLGVGGDVAEYKVKSIAATQVELDRSGKTIVLGLGKFLNIDGASETVSDVGPPPPEAPSEGAAVATGSSSETGASAILRRMMEKRAQEGTAAPTASPSATDAPGAPSTLPAPSTEKNDVLRRMMEKRAQEIAK